MREYGGITLIRIPLAPESQVFTPIQKLDIYTPQVCIMSDTPSEIVSYIFGNILVQICSSVYDTDYDYMIQVKLYRTVSHLMSDLTDYGTAKNV